MVILLPTMMSTLSISGLHKMKPWQWKLWHNNSGFAKKKTDSFVQFLDCFNPLQTHHPALLPCMSKNTASISARCSLQIRKSSNVSMPSQLAPKVWILTTATSMAAATITLMPRRDNTVYCSEKNHPHTTSTHSL